MLKKTTLYYFSPTGGTRKAAAALAAGLAEEVESIDLGKRDFAVMDPGDDVVVVAAPVFGGRIPEIVSERIAGLSGNGRKAVSLVVYGNREYEDALLELNDALSELGFSVAASGAFIAQHSMAPDIAAGRPDEKDIEEIQEFAEAILKKIGDIGDAAQGAIEVPGDRPYKERSPVNAVPLTSAVCIKCGDCRKVCPTGAVVTAMGTIVTDKEKCIQCMACVAACQSGARILPPSFAEKIEQKLAPVKDIRKENEVFL